MLMLLNIRDSFQSGMQLKTNNKGKDRGRGAVLFF